MKTKKIKIQYPWGRDLSADVTVGRMSLPLDGQHPFWIAVGICGLERQMVRIGFTDWHPVKERFESNPDVKTLHAWEKKSGMHRGVEVLFWLSCFVLTDWEMLPKRTVAEHNKLYQEISDTATKLARLLESTDELYIRAGRNGLAGIRTTSLLTQREEAELKELLRGAVSELEHRNLYGIEDCLPSLEEILGRTSQAAQRLKKVGPIHSQPKKKNAIRGFFVRRIYNLTQRLSHPPGLDVIAVLTTLALDELTDRELVHKLLAKKERSKVVFR